MVPDDARELDRDLAVWRREEKRRLRGARLRRLTRSGATAPVVVGALLVALLGGTLLTVLAPRTVPRPSAVPSVALSGAPRFAGTTLHPAVLLADGKPVDAADLRPSVIMIVPTECRCDGLIEQLSLQADKIVGFFVLADKRDPILTAAAAATEMRRLTATFAGRTARVLSDPADELAGYYQAHGLTAILVQRNGEVSEVLADLRTPTPLGVDQL
ncbi:MAG: hypothetical protein ABIS86_20875 [Streptosporangiaceae bacterium]